MSEKPILCQFHPFPQLETRRLLLRRPYLTDTDDLYLCMKNKNVCRYEMWYPHASPAETFGFVNDLIDRLDNRCGTTWILQRKNDGKVLGVINLHDISETNREAEMGFWLGEEYRHNGYASEAARRVLGFSFETLGLNRITCLCAEENEASEALIRRLGMVYEGTMREHLRIRGIYTNIRVFSLLAKEYRKNPENLP